MKSSQGEYFVALDHVRAIAAFTVFVWHFNHVNDGQFGAPPMFPGSIFAEGHIGVAIFMTLSGYLFAKLLDGQRIHYAPFLWNRAIRLFPLLGVVFFLYGLRYLGSGDIGAYLMRLMSGFITPSWPNGGWSIAVELHFYLILPLLLAISTRHSALILLVIALSLSIRAGWWLYDGSVQDLAYWTIFGGIDQFVMGIFAFNARRWIIGRHVVAAVLMLLILIYVAYFDALGGFYRNVSYPSPDPIWIVHPTILAIGFSFLLAWYDGSFVFRNQGVARVIATIGACSYSIYLLHFSVVFTMADWINTHVVALTTFPLMLFFALISFLAFFPIAYLSYRVIELPPMRYRKAYKRS